MTELYGNIGAAAGVSALKVVLYTPDTLVKAEAAKGEDAYLYCAYGLNSVSFNTVSDDTAAAVTAGKATPDNADAVLGYVKGLTSPTADQVSLALAAAYAKAANKTVAAGALTPSYTTTTMSVGNTQTLRYRFEAKELLYAAKAAALPGAEYTFGVLYVGRNATRDQMLTLEGNANYSAEVAVDASTVYAGNGELSVNITRGRADVGHRDTLLPYLKVTVGGNTYTYYADEVTKQSPVGWMKKAMQNVSGSGIETAYNAKVEELAQSEAYKDITDFSGMLTSIAATANQTAALEVMNNARSGFGTQENYYALMKALFAVVG